MRKKKVPAFSKKILFFIIMKNPKYCGLE